MLQYTSSMLFEKASVFIILLSMSACFDTEEYDSIGIRSWREVTGLWYVVAVIKVAEPTTRMPHCWTLDIIQPRWHSDIIRGVSVFYENSTIPYVIYFTATRFMTMSGFSAAGVKFESVEYRQIAVKIRGQGTLAVDLIRHECNKGNETSRLFDMFAGGVKQNYFDELYISRHARLPDSIIHNTPMDMFVINNSNCSYY